MSNTKTATLEQDFRDIVFKFCERQNMTPEQVGNKVGYTNRDKIHTFFSLKQGTLTGKVKNRFVQFMQTKEPDLIVRTIAYSSEQKAIAIVIDELNS